MDNFDELLLQRAHSTYPWCFHTDSHKDQLYLSYESNIMMLFFPDKFNIILRYSSNKNVYNISLKTSDQCIMISS